MSFFFFVVGGLHPLQPLDFGCRRRTSMYVLGGTHWLSYQNARTVLDFFVGIIFAVPVCDVHPLDNFGGGHDKVLMTVFGFQ